MTADKNTITANREDISRFVVHLTRDDRNDFSEGGSTARGNLEAILAKRRVSAFRPHCLHRDKLEGISSSIRKQFNVACFTEVPLSQIHLLTQPIAGVRYQRESYGVVFTKKLLIAQGAQPAIYVNSYNGNTLVKDSYDVIFEEARANGFSGDSWRMLPFVNAMHEKYDFTWEREWRMTGSLKFKTESELVCVILPEEGEDDLKGKLLEAGISVISPGWIYEQIVAHLTSQHRRTKIALSKLLTPPANSKG